MASKDELLSSITPNMRLTRDFFLKVYGCELTWPGFAENVLTRMEILGCSKARDYYTCVVAEYEHNHEKELKAAAEWYRKRCEEDYERRKREAVNKGIGERKRPEYRFEGFPEDW